MAHCKTHRRRHHSKRKTSRRVHRRKTHRRGGRNNPCHHFENKLNDFRSRLSGLVANFRRANSRAEKSILAADFLELYNDVRFTHDEAVRERCNQEAQAIDRFENDEVNPEMDQFGPYM
jgi:hypothetical protein